MTETVPVHVAKALRLYDRDLRLRFSKEMKCWLLERKCERRFLEDPVTHYTDEDGKVRERVLPENSDLRIRYRDGYTQICELGSVVPTLRLIRELWKNDSRRFGKRFVKMLADKWEQQEQQKKIKRLAEFSDMAGETFESMAWRTGRRVGV